MEKHVTLKGTNEGYFLLLDEASSVTEIKEDLAQLIEHLKKDDQYQEAYTLTIDSGNRIFKDSFKTYLKETIEASTNFEVKAFLEAVIDREAAEQWHKETSPYVMNRTVRNGQIIHSKRDILLIGDIRPGGMVRSAGNVLVIGDVQGTIHAGADGDEEAVIIAPFLFNGQVRISDHIEIIEKNEESEGEASHLSQPQIVFLNDLHVIEFAEVDQLAHIRPDFAKDVGGFEEWQRQL